MRSLRFAALAVVVAVGCTSPTTSPSHASSQARSQDVVPSLVAAYSVSCVNTTCSFTDESTPAGSVVSWSWSRSGVLATTQNPTIIFRTGGQPGEGYSEDVTLTVSDGTTSASVTHAVVLVSPIALSAVAGKDRGASVADLAWSGARGDSLTIIRQNQSTSPVFVTVTVPNTGAFHDVLPKLSGKTSSGYGYRLCERASEYPTDSQCTLTVPLH